MKKIISLAAMLLVAMTTMLSLSSCEDEAISYNLEGCWKGEMHISCSYHNNTYQSTYSEIEFVRNSFSFTSGTGYWVDHYSSISGWNHDYVASHFTWHVDNGRITIHFTEENNYIYIDDFSLTTNRFTGELWDSGNPVYFDLDHISSPNWDEYNYDDRYYDDYYYAKSSSMLADTSSKEPVKSDRPMRFVRTE